MMQEEIKEEPMAMDDGVRRCHYCGIEISPKDE